MQVELVLLILSLLFFASIFTDKIGYKFGVPALLLFLAVGMLFGADGIGRLFNEDSMGYMIDVGTAEAISTVALCVILFSGGMDTRISDIRPVVGPGITLATLGVLLTALITGVIIYYVFGALNAVATVSIWVALLMAATMSSTDSASVFSILRTGGVSLKHNLRPLLELESGANDPMAYVLTTTLIGVVTSHAEVTALPVIQTIVVQLVMGAVLGFAFGKAMVELLRKVQLNNDSLYPIMVLTACIFIFSVTYYLEGNPYLAVYVGGLIIGNSKFTKKRQTKSFFDGLTWLSQLVMFLMLGLLVRPHEFLQLEVWLPCLIISVVMVFISRPLSVFVCMLPFRRYRWRDKVMLSWVGLRGAVPIVFAIMCMSENVPNSNLIFNVVFLCTLLSLLAQGTTIASTAKKLRLAEPPVLLRRLEHFDLDLPEEIESSATELCVTAEMLLNGNRLLDIGIPRNTLVIMVRRGDDYFVPTGQSELVQGDRLLVLTDNDVEVANKYKAEEAEEEALHLRFITDTMGYLRAKWQQIRSRQSKQK